MSKVIDFFKKLKSKIYNTFNHIKPSENDMYLFKYRLKNNDRNLKAKVRIAFIFILAIIVSVLLIIFNPLEKLQIALAQGYESYRAEDHTIKIRKKDQNNKDAVDYSKLEWPISGTITSGYGYRTDPISGIYSKHTGIDISGAHRDFVKAVTKGTVTFVGSQQGFGNCIEIKHEINGDVFFSFYAHLSSTNVYIGQEIDKGQVIAREGGDPRFDPNPGYSTGHHLHFEIRSSSGYGNDIDPFTKLN